MLQRFEHGKAVPTDTYIPASGKAESPLDKRHF